VIAGDPEDQGHRGALGTVPNQTKGEDFWGEPSDFHGNSYGLFMRQEKAM